MSQIESQRAQDHTDPVLSQDIVPNRTAGPHIALQLYLLRMLVCDHLDNLSFLFRSKDPLVSQPAYTLSGLDPIDSFLIVGFLYHLDQGSADVHNCGNFSGLVTLIEQARNALACCA